MREWPLSSACYKIQGLSNRDQRNTCQALGEREKNIFHLQELGEDPDFLGKRKSKVHLSFKQGQKNILGSVVCISTK